MSDNNTPDDDLDAVAEDILADSEYDTELGAEMARDARKVAAGDLSREEFENRHAEAVEEEFGTDLTGDGRDRSLPGIVSSPDAISRRSVLKAGAAAAGAAAVGGAVTADRSTAQSTGGSDGEGVQRGMVLDTETCIKCLSCVEACKEENNTPEGHFWMEVHRYQREDREYDSSEECESFQRPCMHCDDAPCIDVCPNNSRFKTENGRTICNYDTCLGCKYREVACPYHVNAFVYTDVPEYLDGPFDGQRRDDEGRWVAGTPPEGSCSKCTFCIHREWDEETRGTTACEEVCPVDAIYFGDLNDTESAPNQYLEDYDESEIFKARDDVADPNVIYVGEEPEGVELEPVNGPTTHADLELEEP
ncbi:MAG: 4Fe-4S ferredoxin N-terminal domain-containing protein, partial [Halodesulfurarchaeum sp.]